MDTGIPRSIAKRVEWRPSGLSTAESLAESLSRRRSVFLDRAQRVSALMAAYHAGVARGDARSVAFGWVRGTAGGPVRVLCGQGPAPGYVATLSDDRPLPDRIDQRLGAAETFIFRLDAYIIRPGSNISDALLAQ